MKREILCLLALALGAGVACRTPQQEAMGFVARLGENIAAGSTFSRLNAGAKVTLDDPEYALETYQGYRVKFGGVSAEGEISGDGATDPRLTPQERAVLIQALREKQPYEVIIQLLREAQAKPAP